MVTIASVILALNVVAFFVIICCFLLHSKNHFQFKLNPCSSTNLVLNCGKKCNENKSSSKAKHFKEEKNRVVISSKSQDSESHVICCLYSLNSYIEFYPLSTLLYFYCLTIIVLFLIVFIILDKENYYRQPQCPLTQNLKTFIHNPFSITSVSIFKKYFIWSYIVLILLLWETLFNFYRFYDAHFMAKYLRNPPKTRIFLLYTIYFIMFSAVYLIQINLYLVLFIITICIHFAFNAYWIHGFITILHNQYEYISNISPKGANNYLQIINRTKKCSFISLFISTLYLLIISGCYTSYISTLTLPIFWMISSICFTLNFVKNRLYLTSKILKCPMLPSDNLTSHSAANQTKISIPHIVDKKNNININVSNLKINLESIPIPELNTNHSLESVPEFTPQTSVPSHISIPQLNNNQSAPSHISIPSGISIEITPSVSNDNINDSRISKAKAFDLLDLKPKIQNSFHKPVYSNSLTPVPLPKKLIISHKRSFSDGEVALHNNVKSDASTILIDMLVNQGFYPNIIVT